MIVSSITSNGDLCITEGPCNNQKAACFDNGIKVENEGVIVINLNETICYTGELTEG